LKIIRPKISGNIAAMIKNFIGNRKIERKIKEGIINRIKSKRAS